MRPSQQEIEPMPAMEPADRSFLPFLLRTLWEAARAAKIWCDFVPTSITCHTIASSAIVGWLLPADESRVVRNTRREPSSGDLSVVPRRMVGGNLAPCVFGLVLLLGTM